jgi:hypothetical protein
VIARVAEQRTLPLSASVAYRVAELARPHVGLLGRDFLQAVRFEYDGPSGV